MIFRVISGILALACFWAAYQQFDDVDPARWITTYIAAGVLGLLHAIGHPRQIASIGLAVILLAWSGWVAREFFSAVDSSDRGLMDALIGSWDEIRTIELRREMFGLLILGLWLAGIGVVSRRKPKASASAA
ncbi:MAG: transmembrane 220 family protein [Planctomycetota bacterium]